MKLERDRHYYGLGGKIWMVVCTDSYDTKSPCIAVRMVDGALGSFHKDSYDLIRPVFEPGQKWRGKGCVILDGEIREMIKFKDGLWHYEINKTAGYNRDEKWLLENCELVKDEPEYIDAQQSVINKMTKELIDKDAEIACLQNSVTIYEDMIEKMKATLEWPK